MSASWKIGTFWGIPLKVHWTFSLLLIYILVVGRMEGLGGTSLLWFVVLFISLFLCVILHEYGHALAARSFGVRTADILILPVGGLARLERLPEKPLQELVVAIAGPAVNLGILLLGSFYLWFSGEGIQPILALSEQPQPAPSNLLPQIILINAALFTFNLIPAFPMDGGRILRSLLSLLIPRTAATEWATRLGMIVSFGFIVIGLYSGNLVLGLVGLVVLYLARSENKAVKMMDELKSSHAGDLVDKSFVILDEWCTVSFAKSKRDLVRAHYILTRNTFGDITGYITAQELMNFVGDPELSIHSLVLPLSGYVAPDEKLQSLVSFFKNHPDQIITVTSDHKILGLISRERILPYQMLINPAVSAD
jgi:Zn-dependent protease